MLHSLRLGTAALAGAIIWLSVPAFAQCPGGQCNPSQLVNPIQPYIGIEGGIGGSDRNFEVNPPFSVNGTSGVYGFNAGFKYNIPGTDFSVGPRVGILFGQMGGTTSHPIASPASTYTATEPWSVNAELAHFWTPSIRDSSAYGHNVLKLPILSHVRDPFAVAFIGIAETKTNVNCSCGASDSSTKIGFTGGVGVGVGIADSPISLMAQWRYMNVSSSTFYLPGVVPIRVNNNIFTVSLLWPIGYNQAPR